MSSLWLANRGFGVSSATLRNILARLEEQGYVRQPHTSAGRVPTDMGYRLYVDQLLAERTLTRPAPQVEARLRRAGTVDDLLSHLSAEVSRASHQVGFAIAPGAEVTTLEHLDFVPLDGGKVLVVVVAAGGHITHKVIDSSEEYGPGELQQAATYLNCEFKGRSLLDVRQAVIERLREERTLYDVLMARALRLASSTFEDMEAGPSIFVQGTSLLIDEIGSDDPDLALATLRTLLRMIEEKTRLVQLLDDYMGSAGLTIVIGTRAPCGRPPAVQPRGLHVFGRPRHGRRRRHRAHADALLTGHQRRGQLVEGHQPDGPVEIVRTMNETKDMDGAPDAGGETASPAAPDTSELRRQRDEYYDLLLRKTAEFDNYRKRVERERADARRRGRGGHVRGPAAARGRPRARAHGGRRHGRGRELPARAWN